ncbi:Ig-like domain-containing protein [Bifidobacterium pseudolongum]|uniref:Ig-like domain-containing protein n=4 Tax=Bifidobacterium pseudolongum TaxID=1694 RepID=UPI00139012E2|nr:Ig-like domain-containing protein [Bifidobacterium pseudolongum]UBY94640.1 Ig-like domain-containing protein [Bifidobacterium pseudolongum]UDL24058.1 Ig-like domain-containing protein [Bifidobacterium pseudolongum]
MSLSAGAVETASAAPLRDSYSDTVGNASFEAARNKYGLTKDMRDGATLHTFMWSFQTIKEHMEEIAQAGYTSIQINNVSAVKDNSELGKGNWYLNWYYIYQPINTTIGNYILGSEDEFKEMCDIAHQYGVRVIVDAVANHFTSDWEVIDPSWQNKEYFHPQAPINDYNDREDCTQHTLTGLWDLNTQNGEVAQRMAEFYRKVVADGADGFRYDAAKHIELTNEFGGSQYWNTILPNGAQYQYGEVLQDKNVRETDYAAMFNDSSINGGGVTASDYGQEMRNSMNDRSVNTRFFTDFRLNAPVNQLVTWIESHDNYCDRQSEKFTEQQVRTAWATMNARGKAMTLFFNRPYASGGTQEWFSEKSKIGDVGSDDWKQPGVVASNHFRNAMVGNDENIQNCGGDHCVMVERFKSDGNASNDGVLVATTDRGSQDLAGMSTKLDNGTYKDEVSGSTITVSGGKITSGSVEANTVAAFYTPKVDTTPISSAEAMPNKGDFEDTKDITLRSFNMANASYTTSEGASGSFNDGDIITIGAGSAGGANVTVTVTGTGNNGKTINRTYTYHKGAQTPVESVSISGNGVNNGRLSMDLNSTTSVQLNATVTPADATVRSISWKSSDPAVATVSSDGLVRGKKAGTTTITATAAGVSASITVTVTGELVTPQGTTVYYPADKFGANSTYIHYRVGTGTWTTAPGVKMEEACDGYLSFTIENPDQEAVEFVFNNGAGQWDNNGSQNYKANGDSILVENGKITEGAFPCTAIIPVTSVSISGGNISLKESASKQLSATVAPANATDRAVSWRSSDTSVVTVDASGTVKAVKAGMATITATAGGKSASVRVTVASDYVPVSSVSVSGTGVSGGKATINVGAGLNLNATVSPSNATDRDVVWGTSNAAVATVNNGAVRGLKAGNAVITATAGNKSSSIVVTVQANGTVLQSVAIVGTGVANNKLTLAQNKTVQLSVKATPANASLGVVYWSSSDSSVATVDGNGKVTAKGEGITAITVTASGKSAAIVLTVTKGGGSSDRFSDVPAGVPFHDEIEWLAANGISTGYVDGRFGYNDKLTRADMAIFLYRTAKLHGVGSASSYAPSAAEYAKFSDVKQGTHGAKEILWLAKHGITQGSNGKFNGGSHLTRQDMAIFLYRYAKLAGVKGAASFAPSAADYARFKDVNKGTFAAKEILWLAKSGISLGNPDGTFGFGAKMERKAMAAFLYRLDKLI